MNPLPHARFAAAVIAVVAMAGCGSDTTGPATSRVKVEAVSSTSIEGIVGKVASPAPTILITDSKTHKPLANIGVEFRAASESGFITNGTAVTDAKGFASASDWVLGTRTGMNYLGVFVDGVPSVQFTAKTKPDVPASLVAETPIDQAGLPGEELPGPFVLVQDQYLNPVPGVTVTFAMADLLSQSLGRATWVSDNTGRATGGGWTLGSTPGTAHVTASVPGVETLVFNAQILDPASIKWYALDSIRAGEINYTPKAMGVSDARIGVTPFDSCLCKKQSGYFIEELQYTYYGDYGQNLIRGSGRYQLDGPTLTISSLNSPGAIENGEILLMRPDFDFGFVLTWVYKEIR